MATYRKRGFCGELAIMHFISVASIASPPDNSSPDQKSGPE